jgi:hypothetical protein
MGTRSVIGIIENDVCKSVYCHWDGYLDHNGQILQAFYNTTDKVEQLIAQGDISSLGAEIGTKHNFGDRAVYLENTDLTTSVATMCTFYARDRDEVGCEASTTQNFSQFMDRVNGCGAEYYYIMKDGVWYVGSVYETAGLTKDGLVPLAQALSSVRVLEDA